MKLSEIKLKLEFRLKPLITGKIPVTFIGTEFVISGWDYMDSDGFFIIHYNSNKSSFRFTEKNLINWINGLQRIDGVAIPKFDANGSKAPLPVKQPIIGKKPVKKVVVDEDDEEDIDELIPEEAVITDPDAEETIPSIGLPQKPLATDNKKFVHIESTVKVYVTKDWSLFGFKEGNRPLSKSKIKKIIADINGGSNLLKYCPIIVVPSGNKLTVIDGQHRLEVAKQLKTYIYYVIHDGMSLYEIAKMNSATEKWKPKDFINCYAIGGNHNYTKIREFMDTYGFPISVTLKLLRTGTFSSEGGGNDTNRGQFEQGKFVVRKWDEAVKIADTVLQFHQFPGHKGGQFVVAICKILDAAKIDIQEVIDSFTKHPDQLLLQSAWKDYLVNLETITNIGKSKRRVIY